MDTAEVMLASAESFVALVSEVPHDAWEKPGLGVWDVRALVGHTGRAVSTVLEYLPHAVEHADLGSAAEYLAAGFRLDRSAHDAVAARGVEAGHELGDEPAEVIQNLVDRLRAALARADPDLALSTRLGAMRLSDYLETRTVELVIHASDLAAAIGVQPKLPDAAVRRVLELVGEAALLNGRGVAAIRQLSGRDGSLFELV